jgi:ribosomal protein S26
MITEFSIPLPDLSLRLDKKITSSNDNKNENKNNINNTIIINNSEEKRKTNTPRPPSTSSTYSDNDSEEEENKKIKSLCSTPEPIKLFKEYLLHTLINYFSEDLNLINNLIELSKKIILKEKDLKKLISLLITDGDETKIIIEYELPEKLKSCSFCEHVPIYRKILSIIINKKQEFKITYNQYSTQMQTEFNISLYYVLK